MIDDILIQSSSHYTYLIQSCSQQTYPDAVFILGNGFKKAQTELYKKACCALSAF